MATDYISLINETISSSESIEELETKLKLLAINTKAKLYSEFLNCVSQEEAIKAADTAKIMMIQMNDLAMQQIRLQGGFSPGIRI